MVLDAEALGVVGSLLRVLWACSESLFVVVLCCPSLNGSSDKRSKVCWERQGEDKENEPLLFSCCVFPHLSGSDDKESKAY